jgi:hypothetical protein
MPKSEIKEAPRPLTAKLAYTALFFASPAMLLFCLVGKWETGIGAWICGGLVILAVKVRWDLRKHLWFWMAVTLAFILQIPIVVLIPWDNRSLTGISFLPVAALDYGLAYRCIRLAELLTKRNHNPSPNSGLETK